VSPRDKEIYVKYLIVIRPTDAGFEATAPDIEGCVARGRTRDQVERQIRAVIEYQLTALRQSGREIPAPRATASKVEIVAATMGVAV